MIKPKIIKQYPTIELKPLNKGNWEKLIILFSKEGLKINAQIDGCGNDFILSYKKLEEMLNG